MALLGKYADAHPPSLRGLVDLSIDTDNINKSPFVIHVKTGDRLYSGTDAQVWLKLGDDKGQWSKEIKLSKFGKNVHERGREDTFSVLKSDLASVQYSNSDIVQIELWRNGSSIVIGDDSWFVDVISVEHSISGKWFYFPVHRWIEKNFHYHFQLFDSVLPQLDQYKEQREKELQDKKKVYQYAEKAPGAPVQVKDLPWDEQFGVVYKTDTVLDVIRYSIVDYNVIKFQTADRWSSVDELNELYQLSMPVPDSQRHWNTDEWFGQQRLQGCNPVLIRLLITRHPNMPVDEQKVQEILGSSLDRAIADKRIFVVDHKIFDGIKLKEIRPFTAPIALFYLDHERKHMRPLAIQLQQVPSPTNPIFYPTDEPNVWLIAKMWFNNADSNYHQSCTHLGFTHLMMESAAVCINRNLSRSHPLYKLMAPHFLYLQAINAEALVKLVAPGKWVDKTLVIGADGLFQLIARASENWRLDVNAVPPVDLKVRGVDDPSVLPNYPYRDDAIRIYNAIHTYVKTIVAHYYDSPEKIEGDHELQNFGRELVTPKKEGGIGYHGVPISDGRFKSVEEITTTLAAIISTCSMTHAAVNFNQYDEYGFPPNYPTRMSGNIPTKKDGFTEADVAKQIPNRKVTLDIMSITRLLSSKGTNSLGDFEIQYSYDPVSMLALRQLKHDLEGISISIAVRNGSPKVHLPYPWLDPAIIPNAISI